MSEGHSSSASFVSGWLPQSDNPVYPAVTGLLMFY